MIARRKCDDAACPLLWRQLKQPVGRASELERPARLQAFAFEPDRRSVDLAGDQRRPFDLPGNARPGGQNIVARDS